jgi:hypothetical protein
MTGTQDAADRMAANLESEEASQEVIDDIHSDASWRTTCSRPASWLARSLYRDW